MPGRILWCSTFSSKTLTPSVSKKTKRLPRPRTLPTLVVCSDSAWDSRSFQVIFNDLITLYWQNLYSYCLWKEFFDFIEQICLFFSCGNPLPLLLRNRSCRLPSQARHRSSCHSGGCGGNSCYDGATANSSGERPKLWWELTKDDQYMKQLWTTS